MDENGTVQINYQRFVRPICLLSLVFFTLCALIIVSFLSGTIQNVLAVCVPTTTAKSIAQLFPPAFGGLFFFSSFIGLHIFTREMKDQSLNYKIALPLYGIFILIIVYEAVSIILPTFEFLETFSLIALAGLASLPIGVAILLETLKKTDSINTDISAVQSFSYRVGYFGLFIVILMIYYVLTYVPRIHHLFDINPIEIINLFLSLIYIFLLSPALGIRLLKLGLKLRKKTSDSSQITDDLKEEFLQPFWMNHFAFRRFVPDWLTLKNKRIILILIVSIILIGIFLTFFILPDTSPGMAWKQATSSVPFGNREGYTVDVWNDAMWIIGGDKLGGSQGFNDTWYSHDGNHWTRATPNAGFEARSGHSTIVFNNMLWVIGGNVDRMNESGYHFPTVKNDIWYSSDGVSWTQAPRSPDLPLRTYPADSVIFDNNIWVFGRGEIWSSPDAIQWKHSQMPAFFDNGRYSLAMKDDRIWVLQYASEGGYWSTADCITRINATAPPLNLEEFWVYTESLTVYNNKFWLFRALEKREGKNNLYGELWCSDDGNNWIRITDNIPFVSDARALNDFHLIGFDKKLWAYMVKGIKKPFSEQYTWNAEIWYTNIE